MGDRCAFFYGTLMAPQVLYRVCYGDSRPPPGTTAHLVIKPAILHDFCRRKVRHCDYPAITRIEGDSVRGTYVTGLTQGDLWKLDIFEGDEYTRKKVPVRILTAVGDETGEGNVEGEEVEADTYIWIEGKDKLEEEEWDFSEFQKEKIRRWVGEDDEFAGRPSILEVDDAVRAQGGDPTGGRGWNGSITNQLKEEKSKEVLGSAV
ncbi:MAG: hypothetical protein M1819_002944 [Sarea resinae]|nr:MAG: hypothetical protein M1819_002944 [Sarea resinae]